MKTVEDFKKRVNKTIPFIFSYELMSDNGCYKFSIYKMFSPEIWFDIQCRQTGEWITETKKVEVKNVEEGVNLTNYFLEQQFINKGNK
jgi:hypothetical protein